MSKKNRRIKFLFLRKGKLEFDGTWERDVILWQFEKQFEVHMQRHSTRASSSSSEDGLLAP